MELPLLMGEEATIMVQMYICFASRLDFFL